MSLSVDHLSYAYTEGNLVLDDYSIEIAQGEIVALVGKSGCGKSTALHCIAGLLEPMKGTVCVDGKDVSNKKPHERGIGIMMQVQPLYEHLTVEQNIAFPLRSRGEKKPNVLHILDQLDVTDIARQKVSSCSGGERRRVAFGRAIVTNPSVLLLDEPFVSLNKELLAIVQESIVQANVTTLLVTHDFEDATTLYDRIIELKKL